ncbi:MAG: hypothetical protein QM749_15565 [Aquabacterium sp.]
MLKELLESLGIKKEIRIVIYTACVTAVAMYFIGDKFLFTERSAILSQNKNDIDTLKSANQKQEKQLADYLAAIEQRNTRLADLSKEISRLQPYEQALPEWKKALDDERVKSSNLQEELNQVSQESRDTKQAMDSCIAERNDLRASVSKLNGIVTSYGLILDRRNEVKEIERNKNSVEMKIAELDGDSINRTFYSQKIDQLKRVSAEYQQQLLQLRQCK